MSNKRRKKSPGYFRGTPVYYVTYSGKKEYCKGDIYKIQYILHIVLHAQEEYEYGNQHPTILHIPHKTSCTERVGMYRGWS